MKLTESLIKQTALSNEVEELEAHQAIMHQFEYVFKAVRNNDLKIEISGIGYLTVNPKKLQKDILRQLNLREELLKKLPDEEILQKLEKLEEDLKINQSKLEKIQENLEEPETNPEWDSE